MAKRIAILYFSGTGNTEAVARMLRDELAATDACTIALRRPSAEGCMDLSPETERGMRHAGA